MTVAGVVHVPWYATVGRKDTFAEQVCAIAPLALRYGATQYSVHRSRDDRYKILQMAWFESKVDWYRYWDGPELVAFRIRNLGHFQVPLVPVWHDELTTGAVVAEAELEPLLGPRVPA